QIESDGNFIPGVSEELTVKTVDEDGNLTPASVFGTAHISFVEGTGDIKTPELKAKDFVNGSAKIHIVASGGERIQIKVQEGVVIGESEHLRAEAGKVFADVDVNDTYAQAIEYLKENNIINGYPDGTFQPGKNVSRGEMAKILIEGLDIALVPGKSSLSDVPENQWFSPYVTTAEKRNIVDGYPDGTFRPALNINMAEFFKVLLEADEAPVP